MSHNTITCQEFNLLYVNFRAKFCTIARSYVRDAVVAEDIVDESFTNFWDHRDDITLTEIPEAYILQSIKNKCLNHLRDQATHTRIHKEIKEQHSKTMMSDIDILSNDNMSNLLKNEVRDIFMNNMKNSSEISRNIFLSSRFHDMTYEEIAIKYDVSPRKVKREIQKTLEKLRKALSDYL